MSNDELSKKVASILRILAKIIEEHPDIFSKELEIETIPNIKRRKKAREKHKITIDLPKTYSEGGESLLQQKLDSLSISSLKKIINFYGFDPAKLSDKWRNKERLINLILPRIIARSEKGKVFKEYS